jgi:hypothetical protein
VSWRPNAGGKRRRTTIDGPFAPRLIEMMRSPAYGVLSLSARKVLDRIEIEIAQHAGADNGNLPVTFEDFRRYGINRAQIAPAIRECEALGFIEITERGQAGNSEFRRPNKFRLTYRNVDSGGKPTHEWRRSITVEQAKIIARRARTTRTDAGPSRYKKQKANAGKRTISMPKTSTENLDFIPQKPALQGTPQKPALPSISGVTASPSLVVSGRAPPEGEAKARTPTTPESHTPSPGSESSRDEDAPAKNLKNDFCGREWHTPVIEEISRQSLYPRAPYPGYARLRPRPAPASPNDDDMPAKPAVDFADPRHYRPRGRHDEAAATEKRPSLGDKRQTD